MLDQVLYQLAYDLKASQSHKDAVLEEAQDTLADLAEDIEDLLEESQEQALLDHFQREYTKLNSTLEQYLKTSDPQDRFGYSQVLQDMIRTANPSKARILSNDLDFNLPPPRAVHLDQNQTNALLNYMPQSLPVSSYMDVDQLTADSSAVVALANSLSRDPQAMFEYVYNTIDYVPSYGVLQGSDYTIETNRGNAFDTSVLLASLMKTAGVPTRFAYGTIGLPIDIAKDWLGELDHADSVSNLMQQGQIPHQMYAVGGTVEEVQFEHIWVQVFLDNQWHDLDASIKTYNTIEGVDLEAQVPFDTSALLETINSATTNEDEGWVQGVDSTELQTQIEAYQQALETYITDNHADDTVTDVLGGRSIQPLSTTSIDAFTVPFSRVITKATIQTIPETMWHRFQLQLGQSSTFSGEAQWAGVLAEINKPTFEIVGKRLAVSFRPATPEDEQRLSDLIPDDIDTAEDLPDSIPIQGTQLIGEITIDGEVIEETASVTLGESVLSRMGYDAPEIGWRFKQNQWIAGEYYAVGLDLHGLSSVQLETLQSDLADVQTALENENITGLDKHDLVGNILQTGVQSYFAMTAANERLSALPSDIISHRMPSFGTFSTKMNVSTFFGTPRNVILSGLAMDIDQYAISSESRNNCYQEWLAYQKNVSMMSSAFEHIVPEQMFSTVDEPVEAVSTVKALTLAAQQGQKIYTITQENQEQLANVVIDTEARQEINNALAIGLEVTVHEQPIELNGWVGSGYSLIDSESGVGAWKISGGESGGDVVAKVLSFFSGFLGLASKLGRIISMLLGNGDPRRLLRLTGVAAFVGYLVGVYDIISDPNCSPGSAAALVALYSILTILVFALAVFLGPLYGIIATTVLLPLVSSVINSGRKSAC